jgi:hypothetical protein
MITIFLTAQKQHFLKEKRVLNKAAMRNSNVLAETKPPF